MSINTLLGIGERETVGSVLARYRGVGPGFDLLRIMLAAYIFYGHTLWIAGGMTSVAGVGALDSVMTTATTTAPLVAAGGDGFHGWTRPFHVAAVPVFFALSGFLVTGSAMRLRATSTFLAYRALRIFPALVMETLLCAGLLGAALTTFSLGRYLSDPVFFRYLGNMVGFVSFHLPGVFEANPVQGIVNANLWTLPAEFYCYLIIGVLMLTRVLYARRIFTTVYALLSVGLLVGSFAFGWGVTAGIPSPMAIVFYFFTGVLFFHWQDRIPAHWALFLGFGALGYVLLLFREAVFLAPLLVTYCTVFSGLVAVPKIPLIGTGDYSYGIYLYGFPIAQALVAASPETFVGHKWMLLAVASVLTCAFAAISWHAVEKRTLALKRGLPTQWFPIPPRTASTSV